jgi:hypothetical protein
VSLHKLAESNKNQGLQNTAKQVIVGSHVISFALSRHWSFSVALKKSAPIIVPENRVTSSLHPPSPSSQPLYNTSSSPCFATSHQRICPVQGWRSTKRSAPSREKELNGNGDGAGSPGLPVPPHGGGAPRLLPTPRRPRHEA